MATERAAKLRRLNDFRRSVPHVTATALAAICGAIEEHGMPDAHSRNAIRAATLAEVEVYGCPRNAPRTRVRYCFRLLYMYMFIYTHLNLNCAWRMYTYMRLVRACGDNLQGRYAIWHNLVAYHGQYEGRH
jgi:hypothetical protein